MNPDILSDMPLSYRKIVPVLLPYPFKEPFDYIIPHDLKVEKIIPGTLVIVPLNQRKEIGVVWQDHVLSGNLSLLSTPKKEKRKLKEIISILPIQPLPRVLMQFIDWMANYNFTESGSVLAMAIRNIRTLTVPLKKEYGWIKTSPLPTNLKITEKRKKILDFMNIPDQAYTTRELTENLHIKPSVIYGLEKSGGIFKQPLTNFTQFSKPDPNFHQPSLSEEQTKATTFLKKQVDKKKFSVTLLQGITGSGKTEVYMQAIASCIEQNKQVLVLLPEIALSAQWTNRFYKRFGVNPALWHSDLGLKHRKQTWMAILKNEVFVLVGARSALFLPFYDLGLIIVDEEHESSFKQEEGVIYNARDMAIVRAKLSSCPIILVSATPSMETLINAHQGKYFHLTLTKRHGGAIMPRTELVDMKIHPPERGHFLSPPLVKATQEKLDKNEQVLFFLNRRGYAPLTLCRACGYRLECPHCSAWLVEHRSTRKLVCHHCDYSIPVPLECPHCNTKNSLVPIGPGIERITEEARVTFPDAKILVMSSDCLNSPKMTAEAVRKIIRKEVNLIIGTQIVAKGWHFPDLTLVGVIDADLGLTGADLRAAEKTLQLLHQVGGRAGRARFPGTVIIQSFLTDHPVMETLIKGDFNQFMIEEAHERKAGFWPPYGRLAAIIVSADTNQDALETAQQLGLNAPSRDGVIVLGPAPAPLSLLRNRYRQRLLLRTHKSIAIQPILHQWLDPIKPKKNVKITVDIDPISFL